ncbi:MAG: hypothetical protein PWP28_700 [Oceanotoga sp.]|nr:hypothetical protein [Oceanotoga sp.]
MDLISYIEIYFKYLTKFNIVRNIFHIRSGSMRLDKYLKNIKIAKRRIIAHDLCSNGKVTKNSYSLKPGYEVKPNDEINIDLGKKEILIKVIDEKSFEIIKELNKI